MNVNKSVLIAVLALMILQTAPNKTRAEERYYMLMFGSQAEPNVAPLAHTFATFVKTEERETGVKKVVKSFTISWLPSNRSVELLRPRPVQGANLSLTESIQVARSLNARVTMWGPVQIKKELYDMAVRQAARLDRGEIGYIALDGRFRGRTASNCMHAVADLDVTQPLLNTGTAYGDAASEMVFQYFQRYIVPNAESLRWISDRLDVKPTQVRFATAEPRPTIVEVKR